MAKAKATELAREAVARSNEVVADAESHAEAVRVALASARNGREARLREVIEGGAVIEKPSSTSQARFALDDAEAELEIARKVLATTAASLGFAIDAQQWAQRKVEAAATHVFAGALDGLLARAEELQAALEAKLAEVDFVATLLPFGSADRARLALTRPWLPPGASPPDRSQHPAVAAWREARAALCRDAGAPLPA
jgi:hypothetical protein